MADAGCGRLLLIGAPDGLQGYFDLSSVAFGARRALLTATDAAVVAIPSDHACGGIHRPVTPALLRGFRGLPWGTHALAFALSEHAPKSCVCTHLSPLQPVAVYVWQPASESLRVVADGSWDCAPSSCVLDTLGACTGVDAASLAMMMAAVVNGRMDDTLAACDEASCGAAWSRLTRHITLPALQSILPITGVVEAGTVRADGAVLSRMHVGARSDDNRIHYTRLVGTDADSSVEDRTAYGRDTSTALRSACRSAGGIERILAELQLSFILFLLGEHLPSLQQWKLLVHTLLCAEAALSDASMKAIPALETVTQQITRLPADFFVDPLSTRNFLRASLRRFAFILRGLRTSSHDATLVAAGMTLLRIVQQHCSVEIMADTEWDMGASVAATSSCDEATYASMAHALSALAADAEDDDMPVIVADGEEYAL